MYYNYYNYFLKLGTNCLAFGFRLLGCVLCNKNFQTFLFFSLSPSYRLQNEQMGHFQALPGGLRVFRSDRSEYGMSLAHTSLPFFLCNRSSLVGNQKKKKKCWFRGSCCAASPSWSEGGMIIECISGLSKV